MTNAARALFLFTLLLLTGLATAAPAPSRLSTTRGFEPNRGQFSDTRARYLSRLRGYVVALDGSGASFYRSDGVGARRVRLQLEGSSALAVASGEDSLPAQVNYFLGEDPAAWHTAIPTFARVRVPGVYPGIDVVYYRNGDADLEYDFVLAPGADPNAIRMSVSGADRTTAAGGEVTLHLGAQQFLLKRPVAFQEIGGARRPVSVDYVLHRGQLRFRVGSYDRSLPLVIDPVLVFSRYLGGTNNLIEDAVTSLVTDSSGNVFVVTHAPSTDFPLLNALSNSGSLAVTKFNPAGIMLFSTFIASSSSGARATVDSSGNLYLVGTGAVTTTAGAYKTTAQNTDFFVTKLAASGSSLIYSTYVGGSGSESGYLSAIISSPGIAVDASGNAYVVGNSASSDFPVVNGNARPANVIAPGGVYAFRLNSTGTALDWSTYIANEGFVTAAALDGSNNVIFGGTTLDNSTLNATPMTATAGAFQTSKAGFDDVFVGKLSSSGSLIYLTFLGGAGADDAMDIAADAAGNAYVTGLVGSLNFPTANAYQSSCHGFIICFDAFVTKINPAGNGLVFSTYFGGTGATASTGGTDRGQGIRPDANGNVWVTGFTSTFDFPTSSPIQASCSLATGGGCSEDVFVAEFSGSGSLLFSTYLGGTDNDEGSAIAVSPATDVFVGGVTYSSNFPKKGPASSYGGFGDGFVFKLSAGTPRAELVATPPSYTFASALVGSFLTTQVILGSSGSQAATVGSIVTDNADFTILSDTCSNVPLNPGSTCSFSVRFAPSSAGLKQASVIVNSNANGSPLLLAVSGTGTTQPAVSLPASLSFPNTLYQTTSLAKQITLTNTGSGVLNLTSKTISGDFALGSTTCAATLDPNASCTFDVTFTPTAAGTRAGAFQLFSNAPGSPHSVSLSGIGLRATASVNPASLSFTQALDTTSAAKTITLTNSGTGVLTLGTISVSNPVYAVSSDCGATLAVLASCTLSVTFTPTPTSSNNGTLTITHDGSNSPTTVTLTGTAVYPVPFITALSPGTVPTLLTDFTLTVTGTGFYPGAAIWANGNPRTTTYVSNTQLTTVIASGEVLGAFNIVFFVRNPGTTNGNTMALVVTQNKPPDGVLESAVSAANGTGNVPQYSTLNVSGWSGDPDDGSPVKSVRVSLSTASTTPNPGIYFLENASWRLRKIDSSGNVITYAGTGVGTFGGDNGPAASAQFLTSGYNSTLVSTLAYDSAGNIYFADTVNNRVRKIAAATGIITTIAGNGTNGFGASNVQATATTLNNPSALAVDAAGNIYFAESGVRIRKVTVSTGLITTLAGGTTAGFSGDGGQATAAAFTNISALAIDSSNNIYIADTGAHRVRRILATTNVISTIAGSALTSHAGDGGLATSAGFTSLRGLALDSSGNVYVSDASVGRVRKFSLGGNINTIAGPGAAGVLGDGGPATSAYLNQPWGLALDVAGNLYVADALNFRIRKIDAASGNISTIAGSGTGTPSTGDHGPALSANVNPTTLVVIGGGAVYDRTVFATLGGSRPDIATAKNNPAYTNSGWTASLNVGNFPTGAYTVHAVARDLSNAAATLFPDKTITIVAGTGPYIQVQPTLAFSNTLVRSTAAPQQLVVTNAGNAPLVISSVSVTGDFLQSNNCSTVAAGSTCTINLSFSPTAIGARTGIITINHNALDSPTTVALSGTSVDLNVSLARPGRRARAQANSAIASVTRPTVDIIVGGSATNEVARLLCSGALAGSSCAIEPATVPLDGQPHDAAVILNTSSLSPGPYSFQVSAVTPWGTRVMQIPVLVEGALVATRAPAAPSRSASAARASNSSPPVFSALPQPDALTLSAAKLAFERIPVDAVAPVRYIELRNALSISVPFELTVDGKFSAHHKCGKEIVPGSTCRVEVTLLGVEAGTYKGVLHVKSSLGEQSIPLTATRH